MLEHTLILPSFSKCDGEMALLYRELAVMLAADIPVVEALKTLIDESTSGKPKRVLSSLKTQLQSEGRIEEADIRYPKYYNKALLYILKNNRKSNEISRFLNNIADELLKRSELKKRVLAAFYYPLIVFTMAVIISTVLCIFVIPVFEDMFSSFGTSLPAPTQLVFSVSNLIGSYGPIILAGLVLLIFIVYKCRRYIGIPFSRLPMFNAVIKKISLLQFTRYLSMLLDIKVPLKEAVQYSALSVENLFFSKKIKNMAEKMTGDKTLNEAMKASSIFPATILRVVTVGEKTDKLDYILSEVSGYYSEDVHVALNTAISILDILLFMLLGFVVGGMVIAMYLPIFQMAGAI